MSILVLIVVALMEVFANTQAALRASVTQADILENGRATMDLMSSDLRSMAPCEYPSNTVSLAYPSSVNFFVGSMNFAGAVNTFVSPASPLVQPLVGGGGASRTNFLQDFFMLSQNTINGAPTWIGIGYAVNTNLANGTLYPLYRFYQTTNTLGGSPAMLFSNFLSLAFTNSAVWSHLMDGVVGLTVRAYDPQGYWITNNVDYYGGNTDGITNQNVYVWEPYLPNSAASRGQVGLVMFSNALPASVEVEMDTLEDRTMQRAESLSGAPTAQNNYLVAAGGNVHVFRQRVQVPQMDPTAYQ